MEPMLVFMMRHSMEQLLFNMIVVGHPMLFIREVQLLSMHHILGPMDINIILL